MPTIIYPGGGRRRRNYAGRRRRQVVRTYNKRAFRGGRQIAYGSMNPFSRYTVVPRMKLVQFRYNVTFSLTVPISGATAHVFRINSLHDPDLTAIGQQPRGYDEWSAFYNHYTVVGALSRFQIVRKVDGVPTTGVRIGTAIDTSASPYVNANAYIENPRTQEKMVPINQVLPTHVNNKFSCKKFFNIKNPLDNPDVGAVVGLNPVELAYLHVYAEFIRAQSATTQLDCNGYIVFTAVLSDRKHLNAS